MKLKHKIMLILAKSKEKRKARKYREEEIKELIGKMAGNGERDDDCYTLVFDTELEAIRAMAVICYDMLINCDFPKKDMGKYFLHTYPMTKEEKKRWKRNRKCT